MSRGKAVMALLCVCVGGCLDRTSIAGPRRADVATPRALKPGSLITDSTFAVGCFYLAPSLQGDKRLVENTRAQNRVAEQLFGRPCPDAATYEALARRARAAQPK